MGVYSSIAAVIELQGRKDILWRYELGSGASPARKDTGSDCPQGPTRIGSLRPAAAVEQVKNRKRSQRSRRGLASEVI
jgi:hypothetical protein